MQTEAAFACGTQIPMHDVLADVCLLQDTADYIRPISFSLRFKINNTESGPVLDEGWPTTVKKSVSGIFPL